MSYRALSDNLFLLLFLIILTICDNTRNFLVIEPVSILYRVFYFPDCNIK